MSFFNKLNCDLKNRNKLHNIIVVDNVEYIYIGNKRNSSFTPIFIPSFTVSIDSEIIEENDLEDSNIILHNLKNLKNLQYLNIYAFINRGVNIIDYTYDENNYSIELSYYLISDLCRERKYCNKITSDLMKLLRSSGIRVINKI